MKRKHILSLLFALALSNVAFSDEKENYLITTDEDTLYFDSIEIQYYKRAVCQNQNGTKKRYNARKLIKVQKGSESYESGRIVPLVFGWKRYLLLYRLPDMDKNHEIVLYCYDGPAGGFIAEDHNDYESVIYVTTFAVRNKSDVRGDFGKLIFGAWRNRVLEACPNCSPECADIIMNTEIESNEDIYTKIIQVVNQKCSE